MISTPLPPTEKTPTHRTATVNSLGKGLVILNLLMTPPFTYRLTDLARSMREDKSNVYRLLATLMAHEYVTRDPLTKRYSLGVQIVRLAAPLLSPQDLTAAGRAIMDRLAEATRHTVFLARIIGTRVIVIDRRRSSGVIGVNTGVGFEAPPHCSATGKVLLAHLDPHDAERVVHQFGLRRFTKHTITDRHKLLHHLQVVRERGYAVDDEEHTTGLRCIAAPVRNRLGIVVAALGISGPVFAVTRHSVPTLAPIVKASASRFSANLGYPVTRAPARQRDKESVTR